mmetsp:Transcript_44263/g.73720  ORF Transcript_44263/g.73720 Transcript_44263/m.73720 type:complete len:138 (+) Transcript_44263:111-524(+)|eukprot:CAMPEP_0198213114 /NCGR_PEP_ID=MMETSP1445-20131203/28681_1 /TAXON_ID=36898 /ORGANISM="Pyramimonas sp., Strain CCMP2087" /LENGTH=137 /DNA_ID=CAMNT_0043887711 /DNA_START=84 /DNA_END=497 /DNA_ORIENTATION=+
MHRIQVLSFVAFLIVAYSGDASAEGAKTRKDRTKVNLDDPKVQAAAKFAEKELRKLCDFCNEELRETYQNMEVKKITTAETRPTSLSEGTMYFLGVTMETTKPYLGKSTDAQTIVVFENADGTYNGISVERSPYLDQ